MFQLRSMLAAGQRQPQRPEQGLALAAGGGARDDQRVRMTAQVQNQTRSLDAANLVGILAGADEEARGEAVVISTHVDHLSDGDLAVLGFDRFLAGLEAGVAAHAVNNSAECLVDPQLLHRGHSVHLDHPDRQQAATGFAQDARDSPHAVAVCPMHPQGSSGSVPNGFKCGISSLG